jgi:uncharacterized protein YndB with AHSA1/START domain
MNSTLQDSIERQITVRAPKERVFQAISDPEQIVKWFPDAVEGSLDLGSRPYFDFGSYGKVQVFVEAVEPNDYFAYRWLTGCDEVPGGYTGDVNDLANTLVEFRLEDTPDGTLVRLKESGFASLPADRAERALKDNSGGWDSMMSRLETYLAQG